MVGPVMYRFVSISPQKLAALLTQHGTAGHAYRGLIHAMPFLAQNPNSRNEYAWH
jgi:hypothetical protein